MANQAGIAATVELAKLGLSADKIDEFKAAFNVFSGGDDRITVGRLRVMLNDNFAQTYSEEDLRYMLSQFGDSSNGVDFLSFAKSMNDKMGDVRFNEAFGDAFDLFDVLGKAELDESSLRDGMKKLGEELTDSEVNELLKIAKKKDDFVRTMTTSLSAAPAAGSSSPAATPSAAASVGAATPAAMGGGAPRPGPGGPGAGGPPRPGGAPGPAEGGPPRPGGAPAAAGGPPRPGGPAGPPRPGGAPAAPGGPTPGGPPRPPRPA
jgi:Ca2+-binding EF-hand superfamily protein